MATPDLPAAPVSKAKLVRDSFTFPEGDYALIAAIRARALGARVDTKKSEVLRAGLLLLARMPDAELLAALGAVEKIKPGRPAK